MLLRAFFVLVLVSSIAGNGALYGMSDTEETQEETGSLGHELTISRSEDIPEVPEDLKEEDLHELIKRLQAERDPEKQGLLQWLLSYIDPRQYSYFSQNSRNRNYPRDLFNNELEYGDSLDHSRSLRPPPTPPPAINVYRGPSWTTWFVQLMDTIKPS